MVVRPAAADLVAGVAAVTVAARCAILGGNPAAGSVVGGQDEAGLGTDAVLLAVFAATGRARERTRGQATTTSHGPMAPNGRPGCRACERAEEEIRAAPQEAPARRAACEALAEVS